MESIHHETDMYLQGMQDLRRDTEPEPIITGDYDITDPKILDLRPFRNRRSPIILEFADTREITIVEIAKLMEAGMNVIKLLLAFNSYNNRIKLLHKTQRAIQICCERIVNNLHLEILRYKVADWPVATCCSVVTSMVRSGMLEEGKDDITLTTGDTIVLTNNVRYFNKCTADLLFVDSQDLVTDFQENWEITIGDGNIILHATEIVNKTSIRCLITKGGLLKHLQYVFFRFTGEFHNKGSLTKRDKGILEFVKENKIDILLVYYSRNADIIRNIKKHLPRSVWRPQIFCAICTQEGLTNLDELLQECDGLLLAREQLQWEIQSMWAYRMPTIQKLIAAKCQKLGKPLFISGGILSSLMQKGELVDNEVIDVSNCLFDGITGFILQNASNTRNAIRGLRTLNEICCTTEPLIFRKDDFWRLSDEILKPSNNAEAAVMAAALVARQIQARVIILPTVSGKTARALLRLRPSALIVTVSTTNKTTRYLYSHRNIIPLMYTGKSYSAWSKTVQARILYALEFIKHRGFAESGQLYVTLHRSDDSISYCDMVRVFSVTESYRYMIECPSSYSFLHAIPEKAPEPKEQQPEISKNKTKPSKDEAKDNTKKLNETKIEHQDKSQLDPDDLNFGKELFDDDGDDHQ